MSEQNSNPGTRQSAERPSTTGDPRTNHRPVSSTTTPSSLLPPLLLPPLPPPPPHFPSPPPEPISEPRYPHSPCWRIRISVLKITEIGALNDKIRRSAISRKRGYFLAKYSRFQEEGGIWVILFDHRAE